MPSTGGSRRDRLGFIGEIGIHQIDLMLMGVDALLAGKHLYIEKPMTRHLEEAFKIYDMAKRTTRIVHVGSHGCSDRKYHRAREIVKSGKAGRLLWAQGSYCRNNPKGEWNYPIDPDGHRSTRHTARLANCVECRWRGQATTLICAIRRSRSRRVTERHSEWATASSAT